MKWETTCALWNILWFITSSFHVIPIRERLWVSVYCWKKQPSNELLKISELPFKGDMLFQVKQLLSASTPQKQQSSESTCVTAVNMWSLVELIQSNLWSCYSFPDSHLLFSLLTLWCVLTHLTSPCISEANLYDSFCAEEGKCELPSEVMG